MNIQSITISNIISIEVEKKKEISSSNDNSYCGSDQDFQDEQDRCELNTTKHLPQAVPDLVSVSTYATTKDGSTNEEEFDCSSSVSSISSYGGSVYEGEEEQEKMDRCSRSPRSIFKNYWKKSDAIRPQLQSPQHARPLTSESKPLPTLPLIPPKEWGLSSRSTNSIGRTSATTFSDEKVQATMFQKADEKDTYEQMIKESEGIPPTTTTSNGCNVSAAHPLMERRNIFGFKSTPGLLADVNKNNDVTSPRKSSSTTELLYHRRDSNLVSCFEKKKKNDTTKNHHHDNVGVSFSTKVCVLEYGGSSRPCASSKQKRSSFIRKEEKDWNNQQQHSEGWSKYFH